MPGLVNAALGQRLPKEGPWRRLSHELGTPLHAVLGHAELLLDGSFGPLGGEARACVSEIQGAGRELAVACRRLLSIIEACGSPPREREAVDCRAVFQAAFADRPVRLRWHGGPLIIRGERFWLRTMADAIADALTVDAPDGTELVAAVEDDGSGLQLSSMGGPTTRGEPDAIAQALIEVVARRQGAEARWLFPNRLRLLGLDVSRRCPK